MASVLNAVQKRCAYINEEQKNLLIEFMQKHPELQSGKFSATFTFKHAQKLWEKATDELHKIPGAVKSWKQWRKTWQDIRSSTKAKNTLIKKHAKQTGGGPASNQVLTEIDQNVLALIGSTVVEGHKAIQESNVQFEWLDNSNLCNVNNDGDGERFSIICTNQEITQEPIPPQNSLFPQNNYYSIPEKNDASEISLNNDNCTNNIKQSSTNMKTIEVETPTTATINTSHVSITPTLNSVSIKKGIKRTAAQRYDKSIEQTEKLTTISQKDYEIRQSYYLKKLKLYKMELDLKKRDVIAKEKICTLLEQLFKN